MKTITKEFWVNEISELAKGYTTTFYHGSDIYNQRTKVKISWEEPEKKIEITESQFDEIFKDDMKAYFQPHQGPKLDVEYVKQKLFGDSSELR